MNNDLTKLAFHALSQLAVALKDLDRKVDAIAETCRENSAKTDACYDAIAMTGHSVNTLVGAFAALVSGVPEPMGEPYELFDENEEGEGQEEVPVEAEPEPEPKSESEPEVVG